MFSISQNCFEIKQTRKKGRGVFTKKHITKETIIGEYSGKIIPYYKVDPKDYEYLLYLNDEVGIVADKNTVGVHLLNHSCDPNCTFSLKQITNIVAIRDIKPQEELTISYRYPPQDTCVNCTHKCYCESKNCLGTMHPL